MRLRIHLFLFVVLCMLASSALVGHAVAAPRGVVRVGGSVPDVVAHGEVQLVGPHAPGDTISLAIALPLRDSAGLDAALAAVADPHSSRYRHYLAPAAANAAFNPSASGEEQVVSWLRNRGLTVTHTYPNHLLIDARGTASSVERAFSISVNDYRTTLNGRPETFFAPSSEPVVDAAVAPLIAGIVGLDSLPRVHLDSNGHATTDVTNLGNFPQDFADAYDVNPLWAAGGDGRGQHIGITLWFTPPADATLAKWGITTGASAPTTANGRLRVVPIDGGSTLGCAASGCSEAGLDIEYASALAPAATINYYEAPLDSSGSGPSTGGLVDALNAAGTDSSFNGTISSSWGECEPASSTDSFVLATTNVLKANALTGHDYLFSSGDTGSYCHNSYTAARYPASSPYVTAVGGTGFNSNVGGAYPGETAWPYCDTCGNNADPRGSGGGYSVLFTRPSWQVAGGQAANGKRGYPDIAADADPITGAYICYGATLSCGKSGGTSLATPLWAGLLAGINSYLTSRSQLALGFVNPALYNLGGSHTLPYAPFHDIVSGTNGSYDAAIGWDAVTGWGSPDAWNLARDFGASGTPTAAQYTRLTAQRRGTHTILTWRATRRVAGFWVYDGHTRLNRLPITSSTGRYRWEASGIVRRPHLEVVR